jgi:WD40 repeat protein
MDYDTREVIKELGMTGVRGMCFHEGELWIAGFRNTLNLIDLETYSIKQTFTHDELRGTHLIYSRDGYLWVTNTSANEIVKLRNNKVEKIIPLPKSVNGTQHLHFNSIAWSPNGDEYHLYCGLGEIVNFTQQKTVFNGIERGHDLYFLDDNQLIVNESKQKRALLINLLDKSETVLHTVTKEGIDTSENRWGFTRGVAASKDLIFLGSSPPCLHIFDRELNQLEPWRISQTPPETIFDICLDPRDWKL